MSGSRAIAAAMIADRRVSRGGSIVLPFPPSTLSGHHNVHWRKLQPVKKAHRELAWAETKKARIVAPKIGDMAVHFHFIPPDNRGDRTNYPNRLKPYIDGIADALGINDRRFLPSYSFGEPNKDKARVEVTL